MTEVRATSHVVERTPELIARGDRSYFKVSLMLAGTGMLIQDDREAVLQAGDLAVYDTDRPYSLVFDQDFRTMVVMFPKHLISLPSDMIGQLTAVRISGQEGLGGMVVPYLTQLAGNLDQLAGTTGARLAHSALDLVTTVFTRELGLDEVSADPHRALVQRIRSFIDRNLASTDLGPDLDRLGALHLDQAPARAVPGAGRHRLDLDPHPPPRAVPPRSARPDARRSSRRGDRRPLGLRRRSALQPSVQVGVRGLPQRVPRRALTGSCPGGHAG